MQSLLYQEKGREKYKRYIERRFEKMAIYHFSAQVISRSKGQSAVASASYRSGERLTDERTGETKYYVREVKPETMILAPSHAPSWVQDRNRLWNEVEKSEKRKNSQLAREINIALPRELHKDQQKELICSFVQEQFVNKGMIADIAIHRDDAANPHAHVMMTTREISEEGFTVKNRDWNDRELLNQWREEWANYANKALEKAGIQEQISHLSHEARGLETLPTIHLGYVANDMEQKGIKTDRGNINREIQKHNALVIDLQEYRELKKQLQFNVAQEKKLAQKEKQKDFFTDAEKVAIKLAVPIVKGFVTLEKIKARKEQLKHWEKKISKVQDGVNLKAKVIEKASKHFEKIESLENQISRKQNEIKNINWFNPLKFKENNLTKERCEKSIERLEQEKHLHEQKLDIYRKGLIFLTREDFETRNREFEIEKERITSGNFKANKMIDEEKIVLENAEKALKQQEIRKITAQYPELKATGEYIDYETVMKLKEINEKAGRIVPLNEIKTEINHRNRKIEECKQSINTFNHEKQRHLKADQYFKQLNIAERKIEKIENNPFLKGKTLFSKEAKNEYEQTKFERDQYKSALKELGFKDQDSFLEHQEKIKKGEKLKPMVEKQIQDQQEGNAKGQNGMGLGLLEGVLQGIEQAQHRVQREQRKQVEKQRYRGQKQKSIDLELDM